MGKAALMRRQRGAIAVMFAAMLLLMLGFIGLAIDLSRLYNRKAEMQMVADAAALAAARSLVGSRAGIEAALAKAAAAAESQNYEYDRKSVSWNDLAIQFSSSATGGWMDATAARAAPANIAFAKVSTAELDAGMGSVATLFMQVLKPGAVSTPTSAEAVAGRVALAITPLAICAMSSTPAAARPPSGELVEYGFRRGVGYDLMQLNPAGGAAENFVINPIDLPGAAGSSSNTDAAVVGPFVCNGLTPVPGGGSTLALSRPFPIGSLYQHLNARFDQYPAQCNYRDAPPDTNIKPFHYNSAAWWMVTAPAGQTAAVLNEASPPRRRTVADPSPHPGTNTAPAYGTLWSFARPVPFSAYSAGVDEPATGYTPFAKSAWPALYSPGEPAPKLSYPSANVPYLMSNLASYTPPAAAHGNGVVNRRVLNVPLLDCPVAGGADTTGSVLAVGRFFMTVPATAGSLSAEFAGIASPQSLAGTVELYK